ncbi:GtrA family protein [Blastococcus litoris]|uniref:GtrA family protein n=1 Tax=Blastococcus litoris TaxID=2171622 RepID=UPI000E300216|nr:GtrA family protein [Blastococcus litoris]
MPARGGTTAGARRDWRLLVREMGMFGVVGAVCFVIDVGVFQLLYAAAGTAAVAAKAVSALVSMTVAYFGHRLWSFSHRAHTGLRREYGIFFVVNGVTLAVGVVAVAVAHDVLGQDSALVLQAVNVGAIATGTVIRFLAYRRWVFVADDAPAAVAYREQQAVRRSAAPVRQEV